MVAKRISHRWRRLLPFSVRGLVVLVLLIGGWLGWFVRSARIQRDAVRAITSAGGGYAYNCQWKNGAMISGGKPWAPQSLVDLIGIDYFSHIAAVGLNTPEPDVLMVHVAQFTRLEKLLVIACPLSDIGLSHLKTLNNLSDLSLDATEVTDAGLAHLKGMTQLASLEVTGRRISDAGLLHVQGLTSLASLKLTRTSVTGAGLRHLKSLTKLSDLDLYHTEVTDAGLAHLKGLITLSTLDLS